MKINERIQNNQIESIASYLIYLIFKNKRKKMLEKNWNVFKKE
jgi:hypothetical protein